MSSIWRPSMTYADVLQHSAKGTTWKNHKYIKKIGDVYYYKQKASDYKHLSNDYDNLMKKQAEKDKNKNKIQINDEASITPIVKNSEKVEKLRKERDYNKSRSNAYNQLAAQTLKSISKDILSSGKKLFDSIIKPKKKKKSIRVNEEVSITPLRD